MNSLTVLFAFTGVICAYLYLMSYLCLLITYQTFDS